MRPETQAAPFRFLPTAILGMVLLSIWQFNSFRRPLITGITIPLAMTGTMVGPYRAVPFESWRMT